METKTKEKVKFVKCPKCTKPIPDFWVQHYVCGWNLNEEVKAQVAEVKKESQVIDRRERSIIVMSSLRCAAASGLAKKPEELLQLAKTIEMYIYKQLE